MGLQRCLVPVCLDQHEQRRVVSVLVDVELQASGGFGLETCAGVQQQAVPEPVDGIRARAQMGGVKNLHEVGNRLYGQPGSA